MGSDGLDKLRVLYPWPEVKPEVSEEAVEITSWVIPLALLKSNLSEGTRLVIELGSWVGESAKLILDHAPNATLICIDHWDGSKLENHRDFQSEYYETYKRMFPTLYEAFLSQCWEYRDRIIPLRAMTLEGLEVVSRFGLEPDLIYVDASHLYEDVKADVSRSYELFPTATLIGDDYSSFLDVRRAVNHFMYDHGFAVQVAGQGWQILKDKTPVLQRALEEARQS